MNLGHPEYLWLFLLVPAIGLAVLRGRDRRGRDWASLSQRGRVPGNGSLSLMSAAICLIIAIAQPRWGRLAGPPSAPGQDVVLLVDVSRSMGVEDAVPNRLAVAVETAESLVRALGREAANRAAVVAFAGRGVLRCPMTENLGAVIGALQRLRPGIIRPGGTDLGAGLDAALDAFGQEEQAQGRDQPQEPTIVVFSDGEDHAETGRSRIERLVKRGVIVHAVAIGDPAQGHPVPSGVGKEPITFEGELVLSRRDDAELEAVAGQTDGAILKLGLAPADLGRLYQDRIKPVANEKRLAKRVPERVERFPIFLTAALSLTLVGCWPGGRAGPWRWFWSRTVGTLLLAALAISTIGAGEGDRPRSDLDLKPAGSTTAASAVARGQAAYVSGQFAEALADFERAVALAPRQAVPRYNAAAALFQLGRYDEARQRYLEARERASTSLRTKIDFALGNTALALGDLQAAIEHYDACLASAATGPAIDAVRRDAAVNRQFALEQARPTSAPQSESGREPSPSGRKDRPPGSRKKGEGSGNEPPQETPDNERGPEGPTPGTEGEGGRDRPLSGRRRTGGAGGSGSQPPGPPGNSPDDRLDSALDQIRDAQRRRLPDELPPSTPRGHRKDW